jgi:hypothetical protein
MRMAPENERGWNKGKISQSLRDGERFLQPTRDRLRGGRLD